MTDRPAAEVGVPSVNGHPFTPRDPMMPWGLCRCGLAEAAHTSAAVGYMPVVPARRINGHGKETP